MPVRLNPHYLADDAVRPAIIQARSDVAVLGKPVAVTLFTCPWCEQRTLDGKRKFVGVTM